ncbi:MAG: glycosyltransferase [Candidatus Parcubacteria bacterium]|nr:glycosyltransferase [Candidatus Parcubacteria bacterium]
MKIALINSLYKPYRRGGAEVVFSNLVKELKKDGHDIFVITISAKPEKTKFFLTEMDDIKIYRFYPKNIFSFVDIGSQPRWKRLIWHLIDTFNLHSYFQIKKIIQLENPDIVLSHNLKGLGYLTLLAIKKSKTRCFHTLHDVQLVNPSGLIIKGQETQPLSCYLYSLITRYLFNNASVIISPSRWLLDFYDQAGFFKKIRKVVLPNPVILENENYKKNIADSTVNYLFLGQLEEHKGILLLLDVFQEFANNKEVKLYVVGNGKLADRLNTEYQGKKWVEFLGYIPANLLSQQVFKKIHYAIVPSLCYENSPSVIYDSFNFSTPVIASAIGGISELVQEGVNGYLFEAGSKIGLLNKLNFSLQNISKLTQMSENAKMRAKEWDIKNYIYKLLQL